MNTPYLSVVIPIRNESASIPELYSQLTATLERWGRPYEILAIDGTQHAQSFRVTCSLPDQGLRTQGAGTSRRRAEQAAADLMLELIADDI